MMTRKIAIMALIAGIVVGGAATEGFNVYRQSQDSYRRSQDSQSFQQRIHCKAVADAYVKENTDLRDNSETGTSVTLDKVDYSPARNSCVANFETNTYFKGGATERESVQDLLSGETLFSVSASQIGSGSTAKRTGLDLEIFRFRFLPRVWDYVMNNVSEPVELEQEYAQMQSDLAPKASSPASTVAEPNDWHTVQGKEYDAQGKPIASAQSPGTGKQYYDPTTGEPIEIDPVTGERVRPSAKRKSASRDKWDKYAVPSKSPPEATVAPPDNPWDKPSPPAAAPAVTGWDEQGNPIPESKHPSPGFIPNAPASQHEGNPWNRPKSAVRPPIDPNTGEPIQESIQESKSQPKSAPPSLAERFVQSLAAVIVVMPILWLLGKLRKRDRDTSTSDSREQKD